ncbi:LysR family transcriptional regulator [Photobacterium kishitanii]|uniref:LysR family transcriptional regulator n=1 Tax=Photobacterium kishitanii TaxID=318456 RepID=UPI0005D3F1CE|nr:LysR family transcriptional regulator [Photobacterium kishitanii]KJG09413.1 hypothetical protein UB40_12860 [Photobacterium kishitanii]PSV06439.1 LysR family transcriptional regulator [Photobacterium kishitanii]PSV74186.1 LysR family transcriptional regulator [Photobacterium kishitanii]
MIDIETLKILNAVAEFRSFTAASENLSIPKSTISRKIKNLEEETGIKIFIRNTRKINITRAGSILIRKSQSIIDEYCLFVNFTKDMLMIPEGNIKILAPSEFNIGILNSFVSQFCCRYPKINIESSVHIFDNSEIDNLDFDVLFSIEGVNIDENLICRNLSKFQRRLVATPKYLKQSKFQDTIEQLFEMTLIMSNKKAWNLYSDNKEIKISPKKQIIITDSMRFALNLSLKNTGIASLPAMFVDSYIKSGELVEVLSSWKLKEDTIKIIYPSRSYTNFSSRIFIEEFLIFYNENLDE